MIIYSHNYVNESSVLHYSVKSDKEISHYRIVDTTRTRVYLVCT